MPDSARALIFFTSSFPFGKSESFIESEFPEVAKQFGKVIIVTNNLHETTGRPIPENVVIVKDPYTAPGPYKLKAPAYLLTDMFKQERLFMIKRGLKPGLGITKTILGAIAKGLETKDLIDRLVAQHQLNPAQLYLYSYWMNDTAVGLAMYRAEHAEAKAFCRAHGWDVYFERHQPAYLPLRHYILENLNAVYCISESGKNYFNQLTGNRFAGTLHTARLGTLQPTAPHPATTPPPFKLVSCSNLISLKRVHLIIEALALLGNYPIQWVHFGAGPLEGQLHQQAEKLLTNSGISYSFKGLVSNHEVLEYYATQRPHLFINVSETEGLPVSIMEAMSYSMPAIATAVGGVPEIVEHGVNGWLLPATCTAKQIADTIQNHMQLPETTLQKMGNSAFNTWNLQYNANANYQKFVAHILQL